MPDTVNKETAIGSSIYSKTLEALVASLDFNVQCWASNSSLILGLERQGYYSYEKIPTGIFAVLSGTYQLTHKKAMKLPREFSINKNDLFYILIIL